MRIITNRDLGGLYLPTDKCTHTGRSVINILREKHPEPVIPDESHFDEYPADVSKECMTSMPLYCTDEIVAKAAKSLGGCAGPAGIDGLMLRGWILRKGVPSKKLRIELAKWVELMSNGSPPFALYQVMNKNRVLPADKNPGV